MCRTAASQLFPRRFQRTGLLLVLQLGLAVRLYDLGRGSVWVDEALEFWTASASTNQLMQSVSQEILDPPLYTLVLHFWMEGGISEWYLRLPSVIFSMLTLAGVLAVGYQLGGAWTSLLAGLLMAVSPIDIRFAQEIGQYSLYLCLGVWSANTFLLLQKHTEQGRFYALWLATTLTAVYSHYGALFPIAGMYLLEASIGIAQGSWKRIRRLLVTGLLFLVGILPLLLFIIPDQLAWVPINNSNQLSLSQPIESLRGATGMLFHTFSFLFTAWPFTYIPEWLPNLLVACTIGASLLLYKELSRPARLWIAWLLISLFLYLLMVQTGLYPPGFRHSAFLLAAIIPLIAATCVHLSTRPVGRLIASLMLATYIAISLISLPNISLRNKIYAREE